MKNGIFLLIIVALFIDGCAKIDYGSPALKTATLTITIPDSASIAGITAVCNISLDAADQNYTYGFCYALTRNPVIPGLAQASQNYSAGTFTAPLSNFQYGNTYYVRAFITNGLVTTYSNQDSFKVPNYLSAGLVKNITSRTFDVDTRLLQSLADTITQKGICYGTSTLPTINNFTKYFSNTDTGTAVMSVNDTLKAGTVYYVRPVIVVSGKVFYGNEVSFRTTGYRGSSGGYIFFDKGDSTAGWRYLETTPDTSIIQNAVWGCTGVSVPGTLAAVGTGFENSETIVSGCNEAGAAAAICRSLLINSKTDWHLPSIDELNALYQLKLSKIITKTGLFMSSTEANANDCFTIDLSTGQQQPTAKDAGSVQAWAARRY